MNTQTGPPPQAAKRAWTRQHVRHAAAMVRQGRNPAARVYESIGSGFFLALAPGWLNLGLWDGPGSEDEAEDACRRLVGTLASALPADGVVVDVGNGFGNWVIGPALRLTAARLSGATTAPAGHRAAARLLFWQVDLLWRRRIIDYLILRAVRPAAPR
jgi:hypothetical protein